MDAASDAGRASSRQLQPPSSVCRTDVAFNDLAQGLQDGTGPVAPPVVDDVRLWPETSVLVADPDLHRRLTDQRWPWHRRAAVPGRCSTRSRTSSTGPRPSRAPQGASVIPSTSISRREGTMPGSGALAGNTRLMDLQEVLRAVACPAADVVARSMFRLSTTSIRAWKNQTTGGKTQ